MNDSTTDMVQSLSVRQRYVRGGLGFVAALTATILVERAFDAALTCIRSKKITSLPV